MSIKIHANRVLATIHVTQKFLGVFKGAQVKSEPKAPTELNAALALLQRLYYKEKRKESVGGAPKIFDITPFR